MTFENGDQQRVAGSVTDPFVEQSNRSHKVRNIVIGLVALIFGAAIVLGLGRAFVFSTYFLPSDAMAPTLESRDRIVVNRLDRSPGSGDVIVHRQDDGLDIVKRVIAVGNETVEVVNGQLIVDGEIVEEPYLDPATVTEDFGPITVPADSLFLMGDNRANSYDSRWAGPVPLDDVVGTVLGA